MNAIFPKGYLLNLLEETFHAFQQKVGFRLRPEDVRIYLPLVLQKIIVHDFQRMYGTSGLSTNEVGEITSFRGYRVVIGYENKIVISFIHDVMDESHRYILKKDILAPEEKIDS